MSNFLRLGVSLGLMVFGVLAGTGRCAAEEPAGDLNPLPPVTRTLSGNNRQFQNQFQMYGRGSAMAFSTDAKTLFISGHMGFIFWDVTDPKASQPRNLRVENLRFFNAAVALAPDGKTVAAASSMGGEQDMPIRFIDTATGKEIRQIENDQQLNGLCFSPDGQLLAVASRQQRIELWDTASGDEVRVFSASPNVFYQLLTFSPDGKMLAAVVNNNFNRFAGAEDEEAKMLIWETASGKERARVRLPAPLPEKRDQRMNFPNRGVNGLAFSKDGRFLAVSGSDAAVHLWDLQKGKEAVPLTGFDDNATALVFTPDGKELIAISSNGSRLSWKMEEIRRINAVRLPALNEADFAVLWQELAQSDLFRNYRAGRHLLAEPRRAVALLSDRLKPVPPGDSVRLRKLAADLSNGNPSVRRKAMMELRAKHGEAAVGALRLHANPQRRNFGMTFEQKLANLYATPERARDLRAVRILEEIGTPEARQVLANLSKGAEGVNLTVQSKAALDRLAAIKETPVAAASDDLWSDLGSEDAARAYRAMSRLSDAPEQALSLLGERLKPVVLIEAKELTPLLARLEADDLPTREQAREALEKAGEQAVPSLKTALEGKPTLEVRKRIEELLERLTRQTPLAALRGLRGIEVLEHLGSADAKHILLSLAGGAPPALVTREAKASLQRLARR